MANCREFIITDSTNYFYTDCKGNKQYGDRQKNVSVIIDVDEPHSDNMKEVTMSLETYNTLYKESYWQHLKENHLVMLIVLMIIASVIGIVAWTEQVRGMTYFMAFIILFTFVYDYITWKRRN